jgi:hypothetical protein
VDAPAQQRRPISATRYGVEPPPISCHRASLVACSPPGPSQPAALANRPPTGVTPVGRIDVFVN